jgi:hypothetical protein
MKAITKTVFIYELSELENARLQVILAAFLEDSAATPSEHEFDVKMMKESDRLKEQIKE